MGGAGRGRSEKEGASGSTPYVSVQGEWGVTAQQEVEESRRIQEFQETVPKMRSQLRVLTHLYQVAGLHSRPVVQFIGVGLLSYPEEIDIETHSRQRHQKQWLTVKQLRT